LIEYTDAQNSHRVLTQDVKFLPVPARERILELERSVVTGFGHAIAILRPDSKKGAELHKAVAMLPSNSCTITNLISDKLVAKTATQAGSCVDALIDTVRTTPVNVRMIAINDFHGNNQKPAINNGGSLAVNSNGLPMKLAAGGAAYISTLVQSLRAGNPNNIMVGAGDMVGASPFASSVNHDESTVDILGQLRLEISATGNHEYDKGTTELLRLQNGGCYPVGNGQGVVGVDTCLQNGTFPGAKYKYLAANVTNKADGSNFLTPTYIKSFGAVKVGFIGIVLQGMAQEVSATVIACVNFLDEATTINNYAKQLKAKGATAVVVLIHQGGQTTSTTINDKTCPGFSGDITPILDNLSSQVDVVVSGHTHQEYVCNYFSKTAKKNILLTQTGFYGNAVSAIDLTLVPNGGVQAAVANTVPVLQGDALAANVNGVITVAPPASFSTVTGVNSVVAADPVISAVVNKYVAASASAGAAQVGTITASIGRTTYGTTRDESVESPLGDLMADSMLATAINGADIGIMNPGSVRGDLNYTNGAGSSSAGRTPGLVTYGDVATIEGAFGNTLVTLTVTGAQLQNLLGQQWSPANKSAKSDPSGNFGRIFSISNGFTYSFSKTASVSCPTANVPPDQTPCITPISNMMLNGVPINPTSTYRIITNSYLGLITGGDNFTVMATQGINTVDTRQLFLTGLVNYFQRNPGLSPPVSRVTVLP
jgi:5'-nucleotidase